MSKHSALNTFGRSGNPAFTRNFDNTGAVPQSERMTLDGAVNKTAILLSLCFGRKNNLSTSTGQKFAQSLMNVGDQVETILKGSSEILEVAKSTVKAENFLYLVISFLIPI